MPRRPAPGGTPSGRRSTTRESGPATRRGASTSRSPAQADLDAAKGLPDADPTKADKVQRAQTAVDTAQQDLKAGQDAVTAAQTAETDAKNDADAAKAAVQPATDKLAADQKALDDAQKEADAAASAAASEEGKATDAA